MVKVVINNCFGGFGLSEDGMREYAKKKGASVMDIPRDDPDLVATVEKLGGNASRAFANLKVVEIPDDVDWEIEEYDGSEWVAEKHRTWP